MATKNHAYYCFEVLETRLKHRKSAAPYSDWCALHGLDDNDAEEEYPLFVTWNIRPRPTSSPRLRGCLGNFEPMPLELGLKDYAFISAFRDRRFDPITEKELAKLDCGVSLLMDFEICTTWDDWDIGVHGIYIHFQNPDLHPPPQRQANAANALHNALLSPSPTHMSSPASSTGSSSTSSSASTTQTTPAPSPQPKLRGPARSGLPNTMSATYLPDVAPAQGWDKQSTLDSAIRKAGYGGPITDDLRSAVRVTRYRSSKASVEFEEWLQWKEENEREKD